MAIFAIPVVLKGAGILLGLAGMYKAKNGYDKRAAASKKVKKAQKRDKRNVAEFNAAKDVAVGTMDALGKLEMQIICSFDEFSKIMEAIQNPPKFTTILGDRIKLPELTIEKIKDAAAGANVIWGGIGGVAAGTFAAFAASGAVTATTAALGSTAAGVAISGLHGVAATNATLALLGGGTLAAGGGGVAVGSMVLSFATFGLGLLIGGCIFSSTADKYVEQADEVHSAMLQNERKLSKLCGFLRELNSHGLRYINVLNWVYAKYRTTLAEAAAVVGNRKREIDYMSLKACDRKVIHDLAFLTGLLYSLCKVQFVLASDDEESPNTVNVKGINDAVEQAEEAFSDHFGEKL